MCSRLTRSKWTENIHGQCERLANVLSTNNFRRTDEYPLGLPWNYHYAQSFFLASKIITIIKKFFSKNKAKDPGGSRKNTGMREIRKNAGFPARLRDGWHLCNSFIVSSESYIMKNITQNLNQDFPIVSPICQSNALVYLLCLTTVTASWDCKEVVMFWHWYVSPSSHSTASLRLVRWWVNRWDIAWHLQWCDTQPNVTFHSWQVTSTDVSESFLHPGSPPSRVLSTPQLCFS